VLPVAAETGYLDPEKLEHVQRFISDPQGWWDV